MMSRNERALSIADSEIQKISDHGLLNDASRMSLETLRNPSNAQKVAERLIVERTIDSKNSTYDSRTKIKHQDLSI